MVVILQQKHVLFTPVAFAGFSKGGGAGNLKIMKTKRKISPLRISPFSCPKLGEDQNKKGIDSKLVRFVAQNYVKTKKNRSLPRFCPFVCSNFLPKLQNVAMPQFYVLFHANCTILATQRGAMAPRPLPKYASVSPHVIKIMKQLKQPRNYTNF